MFIKSHNGETAIRVDGLWHSYLDGTVALSGIDLDVLRGEFIAIIGQNGSGKTTLVKHFNGLLKPTKGKVIVMGVDTRHATIAELSSKVGYVYQNPDHQICTTSVEEEVAFGVKQLGVPKDELTRRTQDAMNDVGVFYLKNSHPLLLSKGERHRVVLASVLAMRPQILVVDEPTTGQDHRQGRQIMELLTRFHSAGHTIIVITHDMRIVSEFTKRVVILAQGKVLFDGDVKGAFSQPEMLRQSFLQAPQITRLAQMLSDRGFPPDVLTSEQMYQIFGQIRLSRGG